MGTKGQKDLRKETKLRRFFHDDRNVFYIILIANILCIAGIGYCIFEDIRLGDTPSLVSACISETALILFVIFHIRYWKKPEKAQGKKDTGYSETSGITSESKDDFENRSND